MPLEFCDHLDEYGVQYIRTEASYNQFVSLLDRIMVGGPVPEMVELVTAAMREWSLEDDKLRTLLVEQVKEGKVRIPRGIVSQGGKTKTRKRQVAKKIGRPVCANCRFVVPRLEYPEWTFAHNGAVAFRGSDFHNPEVVSN